MKGHATARAADADIVEDDDEAKLDELLDSERSPIVDRVNGFMLGCSLASLQFEKAPAKYLARRRRILEFFNDLYGDPPGTRHPPSFIPSTRRGFEAVCEERMAGIHRMIDPFGLDLRNFYWLGAAAFLDGTMRGRGGSGVDERMRRRAIQVLDHHLGGGGRKLYDRFLAGVRANVEGGGHRRGIPVSFEDVLSPALQLLREGIEPLATDSRACFVAMRFSLPYSRRYRPLYCALARRFGCHPFRMWGDLSGETYVDLMLAVIRRCGRVVADVTGVNANVAYEVGMARGLDKRLTVLCERRPGARAPANVGSDQAVIAYSMNDPNWPDGVVAECALVDSLVAVGRRSQEEQVARASRRRGELLPELGRPTRTRSRSPAR